MKRLEIFYIFRMYTLFEDSKISIYENPINLFYIFDYAIWLSKPDHHENGLHTNYASSIFLVPLFIEHLLRAYMTITKTSTRTRICKAQTSSLVLFQQDLHHLATFVALLRQVDRQRKTTKKCSRIEQVN